MACRVQTQAKITFASSLAAAQTITHIRFQENNDSNPVVKELLNPLQFRAAEPMEIESGDFDVLYISGDVSNDHMQAVAKSYWDGTTMKLDAMTSATVACSDTGYSQQTYSNWAFSVENDPA